MEKSTLSAQQAYAIRELLQSVAPDFAVTIQAMLEQQQQTYGVRNPVAFVRYSVLAVRQGRFGPNRGLCIARTRLATTGADRRDSRRNNTLSSEG